MKNQSTGRLRLACGPEEPPGATGSNVAIEAGAGLTAVEFGDLYGGGSEDGTWLSLFAGVTAAFPIRS